jgi:hypothetical protein
MRINRVLIYDKRGLVLFSSLLLVSLLMAAGMGAFIAIQNDYRITANLRQATTVFYLADAGIEWGKEQISKTSIHPPRPADRAQSFSSGTFAVSFLSSTTVTPLSAKVIIRSAGSSGASSQAIEAQVTKTYEIADGAIGLRGAGATVGFSGSSFFVSGIDYDAITGEVVRSAKPRSAVSVSNAMLQARIETELGTLQGGNITSGEGNSAISHSDLIPSETITRLANDLCNAPHAVSMVIPAAGTLSVGGQTWGSRSAPQLHCVDGLSGSGDFVSLDGAFSGVGILVVRNAELVATSTFRWEGLIVVTGADIGFRVAGAENKEVYGAVMINETGPTGSIGPPVLAFHGAIRILYSRSALSQVTALLPPSALETAYASLPVTIKQDYWKTVSP